VSGTCEAHVCVTHTYTHTHTHTRPHMRVCVRATSAAHMGTEVAAVEGVGWRTRPYHLPECMS
jgi:hypothetical protein